jgi:hypothetical protein
MPRHHDQPVVLVLAAVTLSGCFNGLPPAGAGTAASDAAGDTPCITSAEPVASPVILDMKPVSRAEYLALFESGLPAMEGPQADRALQDLLSPLSAVSNVAAVAGGNPVDQALCTRSAKVGYVLGVAVAAGNDDWCSRYEPVFDFLLEGYLDPARRNAIRDPFAPIGFFTAADALDRSGRLTGMRRDKVRQLALILQEVHRSPGSVGNWDAAIAVGQGHASRIFAADPELAPLREKADRYREQLFTGFHGDVENAPYYGAIGAAQIFQLAALNGSMERLDTPVYRELYTRLANLVSEHGLQPDYGDHYFGEGVVTLHLYVFEAAARTFRDPRFLTVARRVYERVRGSRNNKPFGAFDGIFSMHLLSLPPFEGAPDPLPAFEVKAQVFDHLQGQRFGSGPGLAEPDKVVLKSPGSSVQAYAMVDLGSGGHGVPECRGAVLHYEVNGVPLVRGVNKNHKPNLANLVYLKPPGMGYPHQKKGFIPGVWYTQTVPLDLLAVDQLPEFNWDEIVRGETQWLFLDNIRLEGPGGTEVLEPCESLDAIAPWNGGSPDVELSDDRTEGSHSLKIPLLNGRHGHTLTSLGPKHALDRTRFDSIRFDWKFDGPQAPWCFMRWGDALRGVRGDLFPWTELYPGSVDRAEAANNDAGDCHARVEWSGYVTADTRWTRDIVLSTEGVLMLVDRVVPGPKADGYSVGSLWQLDTIEHEGGNWFLQQPMAWPAMRRGEPDRSAGMLVWHAPAESGARQIGTQSTKDAPGLFEKVPPKEFRPITTFASETARAGTPVVFLTVVAPTLDPDFDPKKFADSIEHQAGNDGADLRCCFQGTHLQFRISQDGSWDVTRSVPGAAVSRDR